MPTNKPTILLVAGGDSAERDVSLDSGRNVYRALRDLGYRVLVADPMYPDIEPSEDPEPFFGTEGIKDRPPVLVQDRYVSRQAFMKVLSRFDHLGCDVVFNGLHGGAGEDGTFQAVLDYLGIRYTGSRSCASQVAMNKELSKRLVSLDHVPLAKHLFIRSDESDPRSVESEVMDKLSLPVVVKPNREGSSVGVTIVTTREELADAIEEARLFGGAYLVEEYIAGSEVTAAVMDGEELPLVEIRPKEGFYDYRNKYQAGSCDYIVPAELDRAHSDAIARSARAAYRAIGCRGYARVDFRVSQAGRHYFLEVNTLPGLTASSLFPKAVGAVGIAYTDMIDRILKLATENL